MHRLLATVICGVGLALVTPGAASAAGGPVTPVQDGPGVSAPGSSIAYVALDIRGGTLVERVRRRTGALIGTRAIGGSFGAPGAAVDGTTTGLSADGRRLVLAAMTDRGRPRHTRLLVFDAPRLRVIQRITLPGLFTVDAISPTGRWLYLLRYPSAADPFRYQVRAFDLRERRLLARPIVDPREPDEQMGGVAITRNTSADGRWAYTLYQRPDGEPFVHALDTERRTAACIDLPALTGADLSGARLRLDRTERTLRAGGAVGPQALIDTRTFAVASAAPKPAVAAVPLRADATPVAVGGSNAGFPWLAVAVAAALAALALLVGLRVRTTAADAAGQRAAEERVVRVKN